jgi:RNA polymerase sigma-70 factor (ECF subfamily)
MDAVIADLRMGNGLPAEPAQEPSAQSFSGMAKESWVELFNDLAAGRSEAFARLYELTARRLYGLALWRTGSREDACDVVQEVFVRLAERRNRLTKVKDPRAWLLAVTHRAAVDLMRRRKLRQAQPIEQMPILEAPAYDTAQAVDAERASKLLAELPAAQRDVIYLHHFVGCTFAAIGRITGVSTFTAASRYRLGLKKLRRLMGREQ